MGAQKKGNKDYLHSIKKHRIPDVNSNSKQCKLIISDSVNLKFLLFRTIEHGLGSAH